MNALTTPQQIDLYRLCVLRTGLKLEAQGLKMSRGPSALSYLRSEYGYKGSRDKILAQVVADIAKRMAELERTVNPSSEE